MGESKILRLMAALCLCTALVACGDSDDDTGGDDAGAGTGGTGGSGGTGGGGTGGSGVVTECGGETCPDLTVTMGLLETCCTPMDVCGVRQPGATDCAEPVEGDECGTYTLPIVNIEIPRCCMDDGICGVNPDQLQPGSGCVADEVVESMINDMIGSMVLDIPAKSCGGDAGTADAGQ